MAKILVADDNSNIQKMVGLALKDQGIDVVAVGNGEAAVRKIADLHPDLVLADVFMPVRNGYEVCRYVKEDTALSHIPVILLVGAFDPLDEQEAQRVGADGVLKKPFVPPDPLISMVKSALARVGVQTGAPAPEKAPEPPARPAAELLTPPVPKAPAAPAFVESEPEEEFPTPPPSLKIAAGQEPVAFGNLLDTQDEPDELSYMAKGRDAVAEHSWGNDDVAEEEEAEEETSHSGWRPGGLDAVEEAPAKGHDWREAAFHGESPAAATRSASWAPAVEEPAFAEASSSQSVAVSTLESKPAEVSSPFAGDAWAAAMAAGVEEKIAEEVSRVVEAPAEPEAPATAPSEEVAQSAPVVEEVKSVEASSGWFSSVSTPWEVEARKASLLASTWDAPAAEPSAPEAPAQEASVPEAMAQESPAAEVSAPLSEAAPFVSEPEFTAPEPVAEEASASFSEPVHERFVSPADETQVDLPAPEQSAAEISQPVESASYVEQAPAPEASQEAASTEEAPSAEHAIEHESGAESRSSFYDGSPIVEDAVSASVRKESESSAPASEAAPAAEEPKPDMDALVSRVLEKMNPDALQKMTREILRPVIEKMIQDELNKKS